MAIQRNNLANQPLDVEINITEEILTDIIEKYIDSLISTDFENGKKVCINLSDLENDDLLEELDSRYKDAGWETKIDEDEYKITLF